jgi:hypothetical protein
VRGAQEVGTSRSGLASKKEQLIHDPWKTSLLTHKQTAFLRDWERLLVVEERNLARVNQNLWTLEREKRGSQSPKMGGQTNKAKLSIHI